jgi:hypothetical protein
MPADTTFPAEKLSFVISDRGGLGRYHGRLAGHTEQCLASLNQLLSRFSVW